MYSPSQAPEFEDLTVASVEKNKITYFAYSVSIIFLQLTLQ